MCDSDLVVSEKYTQSDLYDLQRLRWHTKIYVLYEHQTSWLAG